MGSDSWKHDSLLGEESAWVVSILEKFQERDGRICSAKIISALRSILQAPGILLIFLLVQVDNLLSLNA